jgi:hypothetical protein
MTLDWDAVVAYALALPGTEPGTQYGKPAVKANGHTLISPGREVGSFALHIDVDIKLILMETDPATYWQTPHYAGWPCVLVRYDSADPQRVQAMIRRARDAALGRKPPRPSRPRTRR